MYILSLTWSLALIAPFPAEVHALNSAEYKYTVCAVLVALALLVVFMGNLIAAMTKLAMRHHNLCEQRVNLGRYLGDSHISMTVQHRIWMWFDSYYAGDKLHLSSSTNQVDAILLELPQQLCIEVQLARHPLFRELDAALPEVMQRVNGHMDQIILPPRSKLFSPGERPQQMYFFVKGELDYVLDGAVLAMDSVKPKHVVSPGQWACEPALWLHWVTCGHMTAMPHCEIFGLNAEPFRQLLQLEPRVIWQVTSYAKAYAKYAQERRLVFNDIYADIDTLQDLARGAFHDCNSSIASSAKGV